MFGLFGRRKPILKIAPRQEVEVEILEGETPQSYFSHLINLEKKRIVLSLPSRGEKTAPCALGDKVTVAFMNDDIFVSFESRIIEKRSTQIELAVPREVFEEKTPLFSGELNLEVPIPIQYRAMNTAHMQVASAKVITSTGMQIVTNLPIPQGTDLYIEMHVPDSPLAKAKGKVSKSQRLPADSKKCLTEIDLEEFDLKEKENFLKYTILYQYRMKRRAFSKAE